MAKGYTDLPRIIQHYGLTDLTPEQEAELTDLIGAAEGAIDGYTGRPYLEAPVTAENHLLTGESIWLHLAPILADPAPVVTGYSGWEAAGQVLVAQRDYRIVDLATGWLMLASWTTYGPPAGWVTVSYSPSDMPVPGDIELAATLLVGYWYAGGQSGASTAGVHSYSVLGEESVVFQDAVDQRGMPAEVLALLRPAVGIR